AQKLQAAPDSTPPSLVRHWRPLQRLGRPTERGPGGSPSLVRHWRPLQRARDRPFHYGEGSPSLVRHWRSLQLPAPLIGARRPVPSIAGAALEAVATNCHAIEPHRHNPPSLVRHWRPLQPGASEAAGRLADEPPSLVRHWRPLQPWKIPH